MHEDIEQEWVDQLVGKTVWGIRPHHDDGKDIPKVDLTFKDNARFTLAVKQGTYFEGCLINTLRRSTPVADVLVTSVDGDWMLEVSADNSPLFILTAVNKSLDDEVFPFVLTREADLNA